MEVVRVPGRQQVEVARLDRRDVRRAVAQCEPAPGVADAAGHQRTRQGGRQDHAGDRVDLVLHDLRVGDPDAGDPHIDDAGGRSRREPVLPELRVGEEPEADDRADVPPVQLGGELVDHGLVGPARVGPGALQDGHPILVEVEPVQAGDGVEIRGEQRAVGVDEARCVTGTALGET